MANVIQTRVDVRGIPRLRRIIGQLGNNMKNRRALHERWAILALNWINRNFESEGSMVGGWKPLSPNTLVNRRSGSGKILQDRGAGGLKGSFVASWTSEQATVGSPLEIALYHEKGTKPYTIKPKKPGGSLKFQIATRYGVRVIKRAGKRTTLPFATDGTTVYTREVKHPGLARRRMLPRENEPSLLRELTQAARAYLEVERGG